MSRYKTKHEQTLEGLLADPDPNIRLKAATALERISAKRETKADKETKQKAPKDITERELTEQEKAAGFTSYKQLRDAIREAEK